MVDDIIETWSRMKFESVSIQEVQRLLLKKWKLHRDFLKSLKRKTEQELREYKLQCEMLFDIGKCKSVDVCGCVGSTTSHSQERFQFLKDQRSTRKAKFSSSMSVKVEAVSVQMNDDNDFEDDEDEESEWESEDETEICDDDATDPDYKNQRKRKKFFKLKTTAVICDRYGLSQRSSAALINAVLEDLGLVTSADKSLVVDHHKLKRARKNRNQPIASVYFSTDEKTTL